MDISTWGKAVTVSRGIRYFLKLVNNNTGGILKGEKMEVVCE